ncbi:Ku protein, partial [Streptomyces sp. NPDC058086]
KVVDLMAALQESIRKAQAARGEDAGDAEVHEIPEKPAAGKPAKKTPDKKTAKKTATAMKSARS